LSFYSLDVTGALRSHLCMEEQGFAFNFLQEDVCAFKFCLELQLGLEKLFPIICGDVEDGDRDCVFLFGNILK